MSKAPTILKKDESQRPRSQGHQPIQPKILTKASNKENVATTAVPVKPKLLEPEGPCPAPVMKNFHRMIFPHFQIDQKIFDFLESDNSDFLVVGILGAKNVGKSTLMNIIASPKYLNISNDTPAVTFQGKHEVFPTTGLANFEGNTIDMFISSNRIIFLDSSPLLCNLQRRDMMVSECDDIKMVLMMLQLCHLVIVVHDGFCNMPVERLLKLAEQMIPKEIKHRPVLTYVGNRVQPGTKMLAMDTRVHDGVNLMVPDLQHRDTFLHHDVSEVVQSLQEKVFMSKRWSMMDNDEEVFTEKKWGQRLTQVVDQMKNDYFLRKYEALRDKFHQPIETC